MTPVSCSRFAIFNGANNSQILEHGTPFFPQEFEMRRRQAGYFLKLGGKMSNTAVMHQVSDFGKVKFVINKQFLYTLYFVCDKEFFNRSALYF